MWDAGEDVGGWTAVAAEVLAALMGNAGEVDVGLENAGDAVEMYDTAEAYGAGEVGVGLGNAGGALSCPVAAAGAVAVVAALLAALLWGAGEVGVGLGNAGDALSCAVAAVWGWGTW